MSQKKPTSRQRADSKPGRNSSAKSASEKAPFKRRGKTKIAKNSRQRQGTNVTTSQAPKTRSRTTTKASKAPRKEINGSEPLLPLDDNNRPTKQRASNSKPKVLEHGQPNKQELPSKPYFVEVDEEHEGQRLDNFLITHLKGVPKTHIYRIIRKGEIRINKGRVKQTTRLQQGDSIRIPPIRLSESSSVELDGAKYAFLSEAILHEDEGLIVLNKPSGMAVHAGSGITVGVIEAFRALRTDLNYVELVHRLDRETSGCLVLAKKSSVLKTLHDDFKHNSLKNPRLDKRYLCLVKGQWQGGQRRVTKALNTNAQRGGERMVMVDENGSYASSIMRPISTSEVASLMEVKLLTGRTHQVRVHSLSEGHPLAGDSKYGDREFNKLIKLSGLSRLFLHAAQLTLYHPMSKEKLTVKAPLPSDLGSVLSHLQLASQ